MVRSARDTNADGKMDLLVSAPSFRDALSQDAVGRVYSYSIEELPMPESRPMDDRFLSCGNNAISLEVEAELVMDRGLLINASGSESLLLVTFYDPSNPDLGEIWAGNDDDDIPCRLAVRDYGSPVFNILTTGAIDSGGSWQKLIEIPFSHQFVCAEFLIQTFG